MPDPDSQPLSLVESYSRIFTDFTSHVNEKLHTKFTGECSSLVQWKEALQKESIVEVDLERFTMEELSSNPSCMVEAFSGKPYGAQAKGQEVTTALDYMKNCRVFHGSSSPDVTFDKVMFVHLCNTSQKY